MNPFSEPKNYDEMLTKIMVFTFGASLVLVSIVAHSWVGLWNILHPRWLTFDIEVLGLKNIPASYVIVAFLISLGTRVFRLHDRISDLFGIRKRFDMYEILFPLAGGVGVAIDSRAQDQLRQKRNEVMGKVFYKYASSTSPLIDQHLIWTALDRWSWFWICIESTTVGAIAFVSLLFARVYQSAAWIAAAVIVGILAATQINRACASVAHDEVRAILDDGSRTADIKSVFNAL